MVVLTCIERSSIHKDLQTSTNDEIKIEENGTSLLGLPLYKLDILLKLHYFIERMLSHLEPHNRFKQLDQDISKISNLKYEDYDLDSPKEESNIFK
jgi:hypothetical protein